ncbi:hypothetical protein ALO42_200059 [Pseudomonas syringae pv. atrofaciens]|nr:hypothetical protein ALO42_200059 [Pseudomonas syringae pv. atrofaciens]
MGIGFGAYVDAFTVMTELIAIHHINVTACFVGRIREQDVIDVSGFDGDGAAARQGLQPLGDGDFGIGDCLKSIILIVVDHQLILGDIYTDDRFFQSNPHCHNASSGIRFTDLKGPPRGAGLFLS